MCCGVVCIMCVQVCDVGLYVWYGVCCAMFGVCNVCGEHISVVCKASVCVVWVFVCIVLCVLCCVRCVLWCV